MKLKTYHILFISLLLLSLAAGCATVRTKEDVLKRAQVIKEKAQQTPSQQTNVPQARGQQPDAQQLKTPQPEVQAPVVVRPESPARPQLPLYEKLLYKATYLGINVGTMTSMIKGITNINGRDAYELEVTAETNKFFSKFFKVKDRFVSYMDVERLHVLRHEEYRREGNYKKDAIVIFDQVNHKAYYKHLLNNSTEVIDIPENTLDVVTANYYVRLKPWAVGDTMEMGVYVDEVVYKLLGLVQSKTTLSVPKLGKRESFVFQPYALLNGEEVKKGKALGYFADDPQKTPLKGLVKTPIFGKASIILMEAEY